MNTKIPHRSACAYIRSSATGAQLRLSLLVQARRIAAFCAADYHILTCTVVDADTAGEQPELERLLDRATSPERPYDQIIVSSASRLSRDPVKVRHIEDRLAAANVSLIMLETVAPAATAPMVAEIL